MLSGKNKQRFEEWIMLQSFWDEWFDFNDYPLEMQKGVYEKYFDSLGWEIETPISNWIDCRRYSIIRSKYKSLYLSKGNLDTFKDTNKAFKSAVKQLDKLINDE